MDTHSQIQNEPEYMQSTSLKSNSNVLVPLDLKFRSLTEPELFIQFAPQHFDTVLLLESIVPLAGFHVKFLEKLVAGYAKLTYGQRDGDELEDTTFAGTFRTLREAGKQNPLLISDDSSNSSDVIEAAANDQELSFSYLKWSDLAQSRLPIL